MAPLTPLPLPSKWTLSFSVCFVTEVRPSGPGPSLMPSPGPSDHLPASSSSRPPSRINCLRFSRRIQPPQALSDRRSAPLQTEHTCTAAPQPPGGAAAYGRAGPGGSPDSPCPVAPAKQPRAVPYKRKNRPLIAPFHPFKWESDSSLTSVCTLFSPYSVALQDCLKWLHFQFL